MRIILLVVFLLPFLFACNDEALDSSAEENHFPQIAISTENGVKVTSKTDYVNGSAVVSGGEDFDSFSADLRIRGRGNSTWKHPKKPYQIKFDDKTKILGMAKDKKWILLANHSDKSMLRTEVAFDLSRMSNLSWTPDSRFVELSINDEFLGLYQVTQKVEESSNRVNIGDDGFLLEVDQLDRLDEDDVFFRTDRHLFNIKDPNLDFSDEKFLYIEKYIKTVENVLMGNDFLDPDTGYKKYVDIDSFVDWYLINELAKNQDAAFHTSVYMHIVPGGKLMMGPVWDFDIGFGNNKNPETRTFDPQGFWVERSPWIRRMFKDPVFINRLKSRFQYFYGKRDQIRAGIRKNAEYIDAAQARNYTRWQTLGKYVWPNPVYFDTYEEEVDHFADWLDKRFDWMKDAIDAL
ncbi:MAG: CotH kinase family protein [Thiolinea sp.]